MENLTLELLKQKIISVENTDFSININKVIGVPYIINQLVKLIVETTKTLEITNIIGSNSLSKHISSIISFNYNIPCLQLNKNRLVEGSFCDDNKTVLLVDKLETGKTVLKLLSILHSNKVNIKYIISIYDTNVTNFTDKKLISILSYNFITKILEKQNLLSEQFDFDLQLKQKLNRFKSLKNSKVGYNCKLTNIKDIVREVDNLSKNIVALKICSNQIENFTPNYGIALRKLANNYNFLLIDDLGIYNLDHLNINKYKWADIITTYNSNIVSNGVNFMLINEKNINTINRNFVGVLGNKVTDTRGIKICNDIKNVDQLKQINSNNYDIVMIDSNFINEKIINYINKL